MWANRNDRSFSSSELVETKRKDINQFRSWNKNILYYFDKSKKTNNGGFMLKQFGKRLEQDEFAFCQVDSLLFSKKTMGELRVALANS